MPKVKSGRAFGHFFPEYELRRREFGHKAKLGSESSVKYSLYKSFLPCHSWDPFESPVPRTTDKFNRVNYNNSYDGVFNLEFSPDGSQLVAACERRALMVFDPLSHRLMHHIPDAHDNCVNCVSDDHTVALWDSRNLKQRIRLLRGHENWVKNIEYSSADGMLVTSGFDGKILGWDVNRYSEKGPEYTQLFSMDGLMRMRLTPDCSKLVMCTTGGYMILIHDLSLKDLPEDLHAFKPNYYRISQVTNAVLPETNNFAHLFKAPRNRVEFISDFPNEAEVIHSLQVHPQGWCVLSRNTSMKDTSEWSCVHDIQELEETPGEDSDKELDAENNDISSCRDNDSTSPEEPFVDHSQPSHNTGMEEGQDSDNNDIGISVTFRPRFEITLRGISFNNNSDERGSSRLSESSNVESDENEQGNSRNRSSLRIVSGFGMNIHLRIMSSEMAETLHLIHERRIGDRSLRDGSLHFMTSPSGLEESFDASGSHSPGPDSSNRQRRDSPMASTSEAGNSNSGDMRNAFFMRAGPSNQRAILVLPQSQNFFRCQRSSNSKKIIKNTNRLTHYIEEPNVGRGFIKELCFSSDGRLICSPNASGVRLMMFDEYCSEISHCVQHIPRKLHDVFTTTCHEKCVVSTKFSPTHYLLVSGCLKGKIVWHEPVL